MSWAELEATIRVCRRAVKVTMRNIERPVGATPHAAADVLATLVDYQTLGDKWTLLSAEKAALALRNLLVQDMAYGSELMAPSEAERLAREFMAHVDDGAVYLTNGNWAEPLRRDSHVTFGPTWEPLTKSTFDAGVVAVGRERAAMLWVEDED